MAPKPTGFVELPTRSAPLGPRPVQFTVTYRNAGTGERLVALQILVESRTHGPYLRPSDVVLERRTAAGRWEPLRLSSQTGTLYTPLDSTHRCLSAQALLSGHYRISSASGAQGTLHARVALFG